MESGKEIKQAALLLTQCLQQMNTAEKAAARLEAKSEMQMWGNCCCCCNKNDKVTWHNKGHEESSICMGREQTHALTNAHPLSHSRWIDCFYGC